jgi:hypothetical protein
MKEAARTSETSVDIQLRTRQYIPEDSGLQATNILKVLVKNPEGGHQFKDLVTDRRVEIEQVFFLGDLA